MTGDREKRLLDELRQLRKLDQEVHTLTPGSAERLRLERRVATQLMLVTRLAADIDGESDDEASQDAG